ncbi:hypothetical protein M441DRAFT_242855 [Trichoderma asperellum CBS 433.97]|uniref:Uncharacterized protein n=1 Tax=Trichoderma asperellum (strain ATCC 204424 / CBS 433.97 / NBRC 101777) TaxID=1042311 RepID=A0A2T3Z2H7_TRIA4|nr:hypothetical protein M441DRAFT_242855 [Trichoderma asperellum CBS 433.97]PTB39007.1 hypothetical protein M441DRAFT_242855 [Trichoderma asperellum CBS 433.97]
MYNIYFTQTTFFFQNSLCSSLFLTLPGYRSFSCPRLFFFFFLHFNNFWLVLAYTLETTLLSFSLLCYFGSSPCLSFFFFFFFSSSFFFFFFVCLVFYYLLGNFFEPLAVATK